MKVLVFASICICLLNTTAGLKCYECDDYIYKYTHGNYEDDFGDYKGVACDQTNKTTECDPSYEFCITYEDVECETNPLGFTKRCDWEQHCKSAGTHQLLSDSGQPWSVITCCQDDLCNKDTILPSSQNQLSSHSLFYALFSSLLSSVLIWI